MDQWIAEQCEKFSVSRETKTYFRERRGLTKPLLEEIVPLVRYAQAKYGRDAETRLQPAIGDQPYDAVVLNDSESYKVEATYAVDGYQEHHRMLVLNEKGSVPAWGKIEVSGTKQLGHKYKVHSGGGSDTQIYGSFIDQIRAAYAKKIAKTYDDVRSLIIGFEDFLAFSDQHDADTFREMLAEFETADKGSFQSIWVVGVSGNFSASFPAN